MINRKDYYSANYDFVAVPTSVWKELSRFRDTRDAYFELVGIPSDYASLACDLVDCVRIATVYYEELLQRKKCKGGDHNGNRYAIP